MTDTTIEAVDLAREFSRILSEWCQPEELAEIRRHNLTPEYSGCCASHDFYDANQAMIDAIAALGGEFDPDADVPTETDLPIDAAWAVAKRAGFDAAQVDRFV